MMRFYTFFIIGCIDQIIGLMSNSSGVVGEANRMCENDWTLFESSCFYLSNVTKNFEDAQRSCYNFGGSLAEPRTSVSIEFLRDSAKEHSNVYLIVSGYWIGGQRSSENVTRWIWSSNNEDIIETRWGRGEPSSLREKCVELYKRKQFMWNDAGCNALRNYICERRPHINSSTVVVNSDDNITLLCPVGTLSLTGLIWTRTCNGSDKPLPETSSHWDMAFPNLMIQDIQWFHYGTFRCYAVSYFENVTYSFDVNVIHIQKPSEVRITLTEGDTTNLLCPIGSQSILGILWTKLNHGSTNPTLNLTRVWNSSNLVISPTRWYDSGVYECNAVLNTKHLNYRFELHINASTGFCHCSCQYRQKLIYWDEQIIPNRTHGELLEYLQPVLKRLQEDLKISKQTLSSYKWRKASAKDDRQSSYSIGYLGVAVIVIVLILLFSVDIINCVFFICKCKNELLKCYRRGNTIGVQHL